MSGYREHTERDGDSVSAFNIPGKLSGVGRAILVDTVREMNDVKDIQQLVCLCRCTHDVILDALFPWSIARGLTHSYSLRSVPAELTDLVCIFMELML